MGYACIGNESILNTHWLTPAILMCNPYGICDGFSFSFNSIILSLLQPHSSSRIILCVMLCHEAAIELLREKKSFRRSERGVRLLIRFYIMKANSSQVFNDVTCLVYGFTADNYG
ncbi:uncharacterized protein LOC112494860 [Cephus cinctus]|uniref:Uncharacterized protein LOC112494860 n=1 Tax=Cephus cinctus TaxID=211228 RepID=A0AAJ7RPL1_CEPCN|nr:uncharacterized protein LOC112494860 [Cephus cinctus]